MDCGEMGLTVCICGFRLDNHQLSIVGTDISLPGSQSFLSDQSPHRFCDMSENLPQDKPRRTRRQKVFAVLPTLLTLCNAACGFGAITITAKVGPEHFGGSELFTASQLIFLAMLFDMLDGSAARLTNQTSDFGAQLDSLCDAISFGVAPAFKDPALGPT